MFNMILSEIFMNLTQNILVEFPYFFPQNPAFYSFPAPNGLSRKIFHGFLMATHRLWVVMVPIGSNAFSTERLKIYLAIGWIILFFRQMIIILPNDCYFKMDLDQFQVTAVCENLENHQLRMKINSAMSDIIHMFMPWASVFMNLIVFACIKFRNRKSQMIGRSGEKTMVINSLAVSLLLTTNYVYNKFYTMLKPTISQQSDELQSALSFFNLYGCSCFNLLVYFVLDPTNRQTVICTITNRKSNMTSGSVVTVF
nr:hypothetical protein T26E4.6 - Caenorhabditis elegans [Caenorhabditis elegans]